MAFKDLFKNFTAISGFLELNGFEQNETLKLKQATLNLANIIVDFGMTELRSVACNPAKLASYLISDEVETIQQLSVALCHLNAEQIGQLSNLIQTNVDIDKLISRGEEAANKVMSYDVESFAEDMAFLMETIFNMTIFQDMQIPDVFYPRNYQAELVDFLSTLSANETDYRM